MEASQPLGGASPSKKAEFHLTFTWEFSLPSESVCMENSNPPRRDLGCSIARFRLEGLALFSCKRKQILLGISQRRHLSKRGQPF